MAKSGWYRRTTFVLLVACALLLAAACGSGSQPGQSPGTGGGGQTSGGRTSGGETSGGGEAEPFVIGLIADITGPSALIGQDTVNGLKLAIEEVNAEGGLDGRPVRLEVEDDKTNPTDGVTAMQRLVNDKKVDIVFGPDTSSVTLAAMPIAQEAGIVQFTSSLSPLVTSQGNPWVFRLRPNDLVTAELMAQFAVEELKLTKIAVLNTRGDYGEGGSNAFIQALKDKYGMEPVIRESMNIGDRDATPQLIRIQNSGAEGILWWGPIAEAAVFLQNRRDTGYEGYVFGANALVLQATLDLVGEAAEGAISATNYVNTNPDPLTVEFEQKYQSAYGGVPNDHAPLYYDAMMLLREAVRLGGGTSPEQIRDGMRQIQGWRGITSRFSFDEKGDPGNSQLIVQIQDGKQVLLKALNYD